MLLKSRCGALKFLLLNRKGLTDEVGNNFQEKSTEAFTSRVAESEVKYPTATTTFPKFPTPTPTFQNF